MSAKAAALAALLCLAVPARAESPAAAWIYPAPAVRQWITVNGGLPETVAETRRIDLNPGDNLVIRAVADVDGDGQTGLAEAIYALQIVAGIR